MSAVHFLASQAWSERLARTLLDFLWQGAIVGVVYAVGLAVLRRRGAAPQSRYLFACAALAAMMAAPLVTWTLLTPVVPAAAPGLQSAMAPAPRPLPAGPASFRQSIELAMPGTQPVLAWVVALWLAGATFFSLRLLAAWISAMRLRSRHARPAPPEWQDTFERLRARLRMSRPVRLLVSSLAEVPSAIGWLRPVVLIPAAALTGLPPAQLEALLVHELAHIRRHDYLVNILQSVAEALLFYHPAVWWISGHIRAEREHCCDDVAVAAAGDVLTYARALAGLESARRPRLAAAANGGSLARRIARLLGQPSAQSGMTPAPAAIAAGLIVLAASLFAQSADRPKFEVASVKPSKETRFMTVRPLPGGRLSATAPLKLLMQNAYTLQDFQIVGGPAWIDSERWEIDAKAADNPGREQLLRMLQPLMEDRFHLKVHHETREMPVYALAVAKGGPKLASPKEGSCTAMDAGAAPPPPPRSGERMRPPCGHLGILGATSGVHIQGGQIAMPELVRILAMIMGRPVLDRTGLGGTYDIHVEFTPDSLAAGLDHQIKAGGPAGPPAAPPDNAPPSIVTAIQEQLGLKLESAKGPVDVLVIDHVERPSAN